MVPAAVGTDAGGSIRIPASYCGVVGLKATWGAVPVDGYTGAYSTMGAIGPMARDTADCRLLGEALLGRPLRHPDAPQVRIGIPRASHWHDVDPGVLEACEGAVERLVRAGAIVREIVIPEAGHLALAAMLATGTERIPQLTPAWLEQVFPTLDPSVRGIIRGRLEVGAGVLQRVMRYRTMLRRWLTRAFAEVDVIAVPTVPTPPPVVERPRAQLPSGTVPVDLANLHHAGLANLTGIPAISVPCGVDADGFPVGLTFHAPWAAEAQLLGLSARFEALTDGAHVRRTVPGSGTPAKGAA
jgi:Asp-tRNA(Asn)/Glu-tRNA(Gln) amidotransferase A subunit family amidase